MLEELEDRGESDVFGGRQRRECSVEIDSRLRGLSCVWTDGRHRRDCGALAKSPQLKNLSMLPEILIEWWSPHSSVFGVSIQQNIEHFESEIDDTSEY